MLSILPTYALGSIPDYDLGRVLSILLAHFLFIRAVLYANQGCTPNALGCWTWLLSPSRSLVDSGWPLSHQALYMPSCVEMLQRLEFQELANVSMLCPATGWRVEWTIPGPVQSPKPHIIRVSRWKEDSIWLRDVFPSSMCPSCT